MACLSMGRPNGVTRVPIYEYACDPCKVIYRTKHRISESGPSACQKCKGELRKMISAPSLNTKRFTSPTQEKYSKISPSDELAMEKELQKVYQTIWVPPEVKHSPWDDDHDHDH
jgi:putative FmdB family regulatory protein